MFWRRQKQIPREIKKKIKEEEKETPTVMYNAFEHLSLIHI